MFEPGCRQADGGEAAPWGRWKVQEDQPLLGVLAMGSLANFH